VVTDIRVATASTRKDCEAAGALFDRVWGMSGMVPNEVIIATVHAGGYASLAWVGDALVGASWGFLGSHGGEHTLHSHVTGVIARHGSAGVGEALKRHQWAWAKARQLDSITWSFDPLVRRNAYFNLVKLGAQVIEYHEDFYGSIEDGLNRGEHTDRLIVRWAVDGRSETSTGATINHAAWTIATPEDVEALRLVDRSVAHEWRVRQRADLRKVFSGGWKIAGLMSDGSYAVVRA
jgi:predicted GNAT superfamily acetyltransferase